MMGFFFAVSCIIGIVLCCFGGSGSAALDCLLAGADSAVELSISLAGAYLLWMGLINVASEAGLIEKLAARMHKPLRLLMPDAGDASASVTLNLAANFFGLGNAATPFGLDAMKRWMEEIGVVMSLSQFGVTEDTVEKLADLTRPMNGGYKPLERNEVIKIFKESI